jgi:hypothetical protein
MRRAGGGVETPIGDFDDAIDRPERHRRPVHCRYASRTPRRFWKGMSMRSPASPETLQEFPKPVTAYR